MKKIDLFLKRTFDILVSSIALVTLTVFPVMLIIPLLIKLTDKGPAFYKQIRIGKDQKPFVLYKFRTMIVARCDADGNEIMSEKRVTKIGKFLRKTSLDELPQLFNILNGSMSVVGPRPMLDYQAPRCTAEEKQRFAVRPGLTGLAQVQGRNNILWEERIKYDIEYINKFTFLFDLVLIFKTVLLVFRKEGTDIKVEYRGVDRFSKHYVPEKAEEAEESAKFTEVGKGIV